MSSKEYNNALTYFNKAYNLSPKNGAVVFGIANCYAQLLQYNNAIKYFQFVYDYSTSTADKNVATNGINLMKELKSQEESARQEQIK
ncbi:MAG: tetratricopeptide repeat protein [Candidatus Peribacteria bacterium]|nr:tetratricopeptide repeat protein [Candidatus Peribacteria bacterium]